MNIDWLTWSVWGLGVLMLAYWCVETYREFKTLIHRRRASGRPAAKG